MPKTEVPQYHRVFVPLSDLYSLSGQGVFSHLSCGDKDRRNLVAVPLSMVNLLGRLKNEGLVGAAATLRYLREIQQERPLLSSVGESGLRIHRVSEGLDIAFCPSSGREELDLISPLEKKLRKYQSNQGTHRVTALTGNDEIQISLSAKGVHVERPLFLLVNADIVFEGILEGTSRLLARLYESEGHVPLDSASDELNRDLFVNQFVRFHRGDHTKYARVVGDLQWNGNNSRIIGVNNLELRLLEEAEYGKKIRVGRHHMDRVLGISPLDMEQYLALQYGLMNQEVSLFFLCGSHGSGKTLLGYVAAIDAVLCYDEEVRYKRTGQRSPKGGFYRRIVLLKPNEIMGGKRRDVGALPGDLYSKLQHHLAPFIDAHRESLLGREMAFDQMLLHPAFVNDFGGPRTFDKKIEGSAYLPSNGVVEITYSGFMRGRSFSDTLLLIDEAQNFTPYELKTILARMGTGCKVIVMGDPYQLDNPLCSVEVNGLTHAIHHFLGKPYMGLVTLGKNHRSQVSDDTTDWKVFSS